MHIVVGDLHEKGVLSLAQNMLKRGGLPSGLHANESHHAILAKASVDGWEVKVYELPLEVLRLFWAEAPPLDGASHPVLLGGIPRNGCMREPLTPLPKMRGTLFSSIHFAHEPNSLSLLWSFEPQC